MENIVFKTLTGSKEFWASSDANDEDYVCTVEGQEEAFKHRRETGACFFQYNPMTKAEYFDWHINKNSWPLNIAPLITKAWLEHIGIDIFSGEDKEVVYRIFEKWFRFDYQSVDSAFWKKYAYRIYIFTRYHKNKSFDLTPEQLDTALKFKQRRGRSEEAIDEMHAFFNMKRREIPSVT